VTPAAAGDQADGSALVLQQQQQAQEQRPVALAQTASLAQGTGLDTAGSALFSLAALQDTGVLPPSLARRSSAEVLMRLHRAAQVGSTEAQLALADRLFKGLGMPSNCALALSYARQAAAQIAADVEKVCWQPMLPCTAVL
jgi:TPR repeat protein